MSFADSWNQAPSSGSGRSIGLTSFQSSPNAEDVFQTISNNIRDITANVASIKEFTEKIGKPKDSVQLRENLRRLIEETRLITKDTTNALKNNPIETGPSDQRQKRRMQQQKLLQDLQNVIQRFQEYSKLSVEKERSTPLPASAYTKTSSGPTWDEPKPNEKQGLLEPSRFQVLENDLNFQDALVKERDQEIKQIEATVIQVNEIFRDVAKLVAEQGAMIDNIESNIETGSVNVTKATEEIRKASDYQKSSRGKMCCIALILLIVIAVIVVVVYFLVPK